MSETYRICSRCVMDTTDPGIRFDQDGVCNHCSSAISRLRKQLPPPPVRDEALKTLVEKVKRAGRDRDYDCIIGVSGGVDSTMTAYWVKKLGLRPLAVHFDNGWDSELAVDNIRRALEHLEIELYTHVVDWEEFKDLQMSFLKASVPNCEIPTDHGITATLFRTATKFKVRYILSGGNLATESIMPYAWGHFNQDLKHLKAIHRRFGSMSLRTFPTISLADYLYYVFVRGIRQVPFLNYVDYNKDRAQKLLADKIGWRDYGGKHYESIWTRFFQGYYLPTKFGFDKRRAHYSSTICSGLMTREEALERMQEPPYEEALLREDKMFVMKKFGLKPEDFEAILKAPRKIHTAYPSHAYLFLRFERFRKLFRRIATAP